MKSRPNHPTETVVVRPALPRDAGAWSELRHALWSAGSREEHAEEISAFFIGGLREPLAVLLAQRRSGELVGFVELSIRASAEGCSTDRVAYLEGWYVEPLNRRQGIGRALIAAAEGWARSAGFTELASDARADNELGVHSQRSAGFTEVGLVRCFRKDL